MRTILFRGQLVDTKEWVYGTYHYSNDNKNHYILNREKMLLRSYHDNSEMALHEKEVHLVIPETVGQFTGIYDKNHKEIYEGDICSQPELNGSSRFVSRCKIDYKEDRFLLSWITNSWYNEILRNHNDNLEVVGNVFDNADLVSF